MREWAACHRLAIEGAGSLPRCRGRAVATVLSMSWHDWAADQGRKRRRRAVESAELSCSCRPMASPLKQLAAVTASRLGSLPTRGRGAATPTPSSRPRFGRAQLNAGAIAGLQLAACALRSRRACAQAAVASTLAQRVARVAGSADAHCRSSVLASGGQLAEKPRHVPCCCSRPGRVCSLPFGLLHRRAAVKLSGPWAI